MSLFLYKYRVVFRFSTASLPRHNNLQFVYFYSRQVTKMKMKM